MTVNQLTRVSLKGLINGGLDLPVVLHRGEAFFGQSYHLGYILLCGGQDHGGFHCIFCLNYGVIVP